MTAATMASQKKRRPMCDLAKTGRPAFLRNEKRRKWPPPPLVTLFVRARDSAIEPAAMGDHTAAYVIGGVVVVLAVLWWFGEEWRKNLRRLSHRYSHKYHKLKK